MAFKLDCYYYSLAGIIVLLFLLITESSQQATETGIIKTRVFISPKITLLPGLVSNKYYNNIEFPRGHIAIKSFNGEVVDGEGKPIPLHETYLHHWVVLRYYQRKGVTANNSSNDDPDLINIRNSGVCDSGLSQYFGIGSETRRTATDIPNPYGVEVGNEADVPEGYEEVWVMNVHAIDTRGTEDRMGCTECRCDLYNVTKDEYGMSLPEGYVGGLRCCYDGSKCRVKKGIDRSAEKRDVYVRYTVKYVDWSDSIVPLKIYILDVTDLWTKGDESRGIKAQHNCLIEYNVESSPNGEGTHTKTLKANLPINGDLIYGVGHLHAGGTGTALYGEGGREICSSYPIYGKGNEAGNESGFIVGMTTCYPWPGSIKIFPGETLTLVSNYSSTTDHTGVMGIFHLYVAEPSTQYSSQDLSISQIYDDVVTKMNVSNWASVAVFGLAVLVGAVVFFVVLRGRLERPDGYEPVA